jgi:hypothetical protein
MRKVEVRYRDRSLGLPTPADTVDLLLQMGVMKPWITKKVIELLGFEDDVLIEYIYSLLEDPENPVGRALIAYDGGPRAGGN